MSLYHSPRVVSTNLLLNLDFRNPKRFLTDFGAGNLVQTPKYSAATWSSLYPANTTLTTGIDAPDGTKTAVRISCRTSGNSLLRVNFTSFTPNGTDTYAVSFWARRISGTTSTSNTLFSDVNDLNNYNYVNDLVTNKWVRVVYTGVFSAAAKNVLDLLSDNTNDYVLDFWGVKIENITAANNPYPVKDLVSGYTFNIYRPQYTTLDSEYITFSRTTQPTAKHGGLAFTTGTGSLTSTNFLYNDHTWEVWFRINDVTAEGTANEGYSCLTNYRGYHSGFHYSSTSLFYYMWNGTTAGTPCTWTLGTSGTQVIQGQWYQIAVTRSGDNYTPYLNGVELGTKVPYPTPLGNPSTNGISNDIHIGAMANVAAGASQFVYYSRNTVSNMKMYNRALTAAEIKQNFNALRGRHGL